MAAATKINRVIVVEQGYQRRTPVKDKETLLSHSNVLPDVDSTKVVDPIGLAHLLFNESN